jgi:ubiquinone/menaquinone biosynthesis C-methylase UbiE
MNLCHASLVALWAVVSLTGCKSGTEAGKQAAHNHNLPGIDCPLRKAGVNADQLRPFAEVEKYIAFLDRPERDAWQKPDDVVRALRLKGDETVYDLGAGSGYFSFRIARALPMGKVLAADLEPEMIRHIHHKATTEGYTNVLPVIIKGNDPQISPEADVVLVCDVLHHVADREKWLKRAVSEMKPTARFVLIEFKEGKLPEGPPEAAKIPRKQLIEMVTKSGLRFEAEEPELLPYQVFLVFRKNG